MLQTGMSREEQRTVDPGSAVEALLIRTLAASQTLPAEFDGQHQLESEILHGLRDRSHVIPF